MLFYKFLCTLGYHTLQSLCGRCCIEGKLAAHFGTIYVWFATALKQNYTANDFSGGEQRN